MPALSLLPPQAVSMSEPAARAATDTAILARVLRAVLVILMAFPFVRYGSRFETDRPVKITYG
ncbi:hypothetical protein Sros01_29490 [Streptomyces roseochromogenus]|nr:hypothetical protein GCM10010286_00940 [Streptomyces toxytricini]GLX36876.1 hypothetical protein Sros01_29490 [Streptomyces roseochromogenus]